MINYKEFERKVKSMSAHDIIMSMVNGWRDPRTKINMSTYGLIDNGVCYGCAATNAVLRIMDANKEEVEDHVIARASKAYIPSDVRRFEMAIDLLRCGMLDNYNEYAYNLGIAQINPIPGQELPVLDNDYTEEELKEYEKLAKYQLTIKTNNND